MHSMPDPPYFAVIFTALRRERPTDGYEQTDARMEELARQQPGFLGVEFVCGADGVSVTISYWRTLEELTAWGRHPEHLLAQKRGREEWYQWYTLRVCRIDRATEFTRPEDAA